MTGSATAEPPDTGPLRLRGGQVLDDWIDYNGHMNVAYYVLAFDQAVDLMLEEIGIGPTHVKATGQGPYALQTSIHYLDEMLQGEAFAFDALLIDQDNKRIHVLLRMLKGVSVVATYEQVLMNVDHATRRSTPYPDWAQARLADLCAAHADLPRPSQYGQPLGLRRM